MSRTNRISWRNTAILATATLLSTIGCRQLGIRSPQGSPTPIEPSAPMYSPPAESSGPMLQEIPPLPPSSAMNQTYSTPRTLGWSRPRHAPVQPASALLPEAEIAPPTPVVPVDEIESAFDDETETSDEGVALLLPPESGLADEELVPPPQDIDEDLTAVPTLPIAKNLVELDVTEFLVELEQTPAPIQAQKVLEPVAVSLHTMNSVVTAPQPATTKELIVAPWSPQDANHGIAIHPGPTGTGNRLELYPVPASPWNTGRYSPPSVPPSWNSMNSWAGQNSDWGGRQFR